MAGRDLMIDDIIDPTHLSAYIASRICHDLVSSVSSVTSALDFMNEPQESEMREQADLLLKKGAADSAIRLEYLRYAFGSVGLHGGIADSHEAKRIATGFVHSHRPTLDWKIDSQSLSPAHYRLVMNLILVGIECLPRGGVLTPEVLPVENNLTFIVTARGKRAKIRDDISGPLNGEIPEGGWSARTIQPLFTRIIAGQFGTSVSIGVTGEEEITIRCINVPASVD